VPLRRLKEDGELARVLSAMNTQATPLAGRKILLLEDEYYLADELRRTLEGAGAVVVGPFGEIEDGLAALTSREELNGAVLDINLHGRSVLPVAKELRRLGIPFVFTTGYDRAAIPEFVQDVPRCEKPIDQTELVRLLSNL
jgi:DNA-binding LytR/AlgR family response regulator